MVALVIDLDESVHVFSSPMSYPSGRTALNVRNPIVFSQLPERRLELSLEDLQAFRVVLTARRARTCGISIR